MSIIKSYSNQQIIMDSDLPSIFLAGPTKRNGITKWRVEACEYLNQIGFGGIVYIPEYFNSNFDNSKIEEQCLWERAGLDFCDCILFWIPRNLEEGMPAFTTNVEFGTYMQMKPERVVYGRPSDAQKMRYLDWLYCYEKGPDANIHSDFKSAVNTAAEVAEWYCKIRNL